MIGAVRLLLVVTLVVLLGGTGLGQKPTLKILFFQSFVPACDEVRVQIAQRFAELYAVNVQVDFVSVSEGYAKLAAEAQAGIGHDIVMAENLTVALYKDLLVPIDEVVEEIIEAWGPFHQIGRLLCFFDGHWLALPGWATPFSGLYRKDLFKAAGVETLYSWEDLLVAGERLSKLGYKIGFAISSCGDANNSLIQLMWAFGSRIADETGVIRLDSDETRKAIDFAAKLYQYMPEAVLAWDNAGNNRFMLSGEGAWTFNPISIVRTAERDVPQLAQLFAVHGPLSGPAGAFGSADFYSLMIWKFSPNVDVAKEFLRYFYKEENISAFLDAGKGFNLAAHPRFDAHHVFYEDPRWGHLVGYLRFVRPFGWPAPVDGRAQLVYTSWVIPSMFAKVITGAATIDRAIAEAEKALADIGYLPRRQ